MIDEHFNPLWNGNLLFGKLTLIYFKEHDRRKNSEGFVLTD
jgi:hypothetical protein